MDGTQQVLAETNQSAFNVNAGDQEVASMTKRTSITARMSELQAM
jgi:hypothetical protein